MMNFKTFRTSLTEKTESSVVKSYKIKTYKAEIKKDGNKFIAHLDGDKLDVFKSVKDAEKALKDFVDLLGTQ